MHRFVRTAWKWTVHKIFLAGLSLASFLAWCALAGLGTIVYLHFKPALGLAADPAGEVMAWQQVALCLAAATVLAYAMRWIARHTYPEMDAIPRDDAAIFEAIGAHGFVRRAIARLAIKRARRLAGA